MLLPCNVYKERLIVFKADRKKIQTAGSIRVRVGVCVRIRVIRKVEVNDSVYDRVYWRSFFSFYYLSLQKINIKESIHFVFSIISFLHRNQIPNRTELHENTIHSNYTTNSQQPTTHNSIVYVGSADDYIV